MHVTCSWRCHLARKPLGIGVEVPQRAEGWGIRRLCYNYVSHYLSSGTLSVFRISTAKKSTDVCRDMSCLAAIVLDLHYMNGRRMSRGPELGGGNHSRQPGMEKRFAITKSWLA